MTVSYEWDVETVEIGDDPEILDHDHCQNLKEARSRASQPANTGFRHSIVLVRDADAGRSWAYITDDGKLPEYFSDAYGNDDTKVPQRFHKELLTA